MRSVTSSLRSISALRNSFTSRRNNFCEQEPMGAVLRVRSFASGVGSEDTLPRNQHARASDMSKNVSPGSQLPANSLTARSDHTCSLLDAPEDSNNGLLLKS